MEAFIANLLQSQKAELRLEHNALRYLPGNRTLVVSFSPAKGLARPTEAASLIWGEGFLSARGVSILGVDSFEDDWYRAASLHHVLEQLGASGFFAQHERVIFYGGSMGGFAAMTFAPLAPGCTVLAHNPQSTLIPVKTPWETRFNVGRKHDWQGKFNDAANGVRAAQTVYVTYDPYCMEDRLHVDRLPLDNLVKLPVPYVGHQMPVWLQKMGVLGDVFDLICSKQLSVPRFRALVRARLILPNYFDRIARDPRHKKHLIKLLEMARAAYPKHTEPRQRLWDETQAATSPQPPARPPVVIWCDDPAALSQLQPWYGQHHAGQALLPLLTRPARPHDLPTLFEQPSHMEMVHDEVRRLTSTGPDFVHLVPGSCGLFELFLLHHLQSRDYRHFVVRTQAAQPSEALAPIEEWLTLNQAGWQTLSLPLLADPAPELHEFFRPIAPPDATQAVPIPPEPPAPAALLAPLILGIERFNVGPHACTLDELNQVLVAGNFLEKFATTQGRCATGEPTIPRVVMQFWDKAPPEQVQRLLDHNRMLCLHHNIAYHLYDEASALALMHTYRAGHVIRVFEAAPHPAMKCDLFRLWYLQQFGGYYIDADLAMTDQFPKAMETPGDVVVFQWDNGKLNTVCNWLMGSAPGSLLMRHACEVTWRSAAIALHANPARAMQNILGVSGPGRFTRAVGAWVKRFHQPEARLPITLQTVSYAYTIVRNGPQFLKVPLEYKQTQRHWKKHATV